MTTDKDDKDSIVIGIDLGTTNSLISFIKDKTPRIVPNERGNRMTPSVVFFKENGQVIVGEMAKNQAVLNAERTISNVKLLMGKDKEFKIGNKVYTPADVSSFILKYLKQSATRYFGKEVVDAIITVPAYFDDRQREDTLKAAEMAELNVLKLLNEPTAAALTYGFSEKQKTRLLVLDMGGGTLDITLMEYKDSIFRVRGVGGSTSIGGVNFDQIIVNYMLKDFEQTYGFDLSKDKIALQQLIIHAEKAKLDLSSTEETRIMIPYITVTEKGPIHLNMELTRDRFESLIEPVLIQIDQHINQTFEQSKISPEWVETVILVGGSTRVPAIENRIKKWMTPKISMGNNLKDQNNSASEPSLKRNINPDEAVARGAGILAGILEGSLTHIEFYDITSHDLGIEDDQGNIVVILPRGTTYPAKASRLFTTTEDDQKAVYINIMQEVAMGEQDNKTVSIGLFELKIKEGRKKGEPNIDVTFAIDANGMLNVSAFDLDTGQAKQISIKSDRVAAACKGFISTDPKKIHN